MAVDVLVWIWILIKRIAVPLVAFLLFDISRILAITMDCTRKGRMFFIFLSVIMLLLFWVAVLRMLNPLQML